MSAVAGVLKRRLILFKHGDKGACAQAFFPGKHSGGCVRHYRHKKCVRSPNRGITVTSTQLHKVALNASVRCVYKGLNVYMKNKHT